jgi:hypothetical protein
MRRKSLLQMYHELKESASSSDFPNLLGNTMYKVLLKEFLGFPSPWRQYCQVGNLADFKSHDRVILSGAPDLDRIAADGNYQDAKFSDAKYSILLETFGKTFKLDRRTIINDDLNGLTRIPGAMGKASVRTMVKQILNMLKGGVNAYDGATLFALRGGAAVNYNVNVALANTAAGAAAVAAAMSKMRLGTDPVTGELLGVTPKFLLTGTTLAPVARQLLGSATLWPASANGGTPNNNVQMLIPIEEPLIDSQISTTFWAVLADPADCPVIEIGFLDGKENPDLLVEKPSMMNLAGGGDDPYGYEFDELRYKVRHDWGMQLAYYQGICRGNS